MHAESPEGGDRGPTQDLMEPLNSDLRELVSQEEPEIKNASNQAICKFIGNRGITLDLYGHGHGSPHVGHVPEFALGADQVGGVVSISVACRGAPVEELAPVPVHDGPVAGLDLQLGEPLPQPEHVLTGSSGGYLQVVVTEDQPPCLAVEKHLVAALPGHCEGERVLGVGELDA